PTSFHSDPWWYKPRENGKKILLSDKQRIDK
ncbi:unnamed protein product, partial [marine sediment metagenome]